MEPVSQIIFLRKSLQVLIFFHTFAATNKKTSAMGLTGFDSGLGWCVSMRSEDC